MFGIAVAEVEPANNLMTGLAHSTADVASAMAPCRLDAGIWRASGRCVVVLFPLLITAPGELGVWCRCETGPPRRQALRECCRRCET